MVLFQSPIKGIKTNMEQHSIDQMMDGISDAALVEAMEAYERDHEPMEWHDDSLVEAIEAYEMDQPMDDTYEGDQSMEVSQIGGSPLFEFRLAPTQPRRNWRNVVDKQVFNAEI